MGELKDKMIREMQLRDFSKRTQDSYVSAVEGLLKHYPDKSPLKIGQQDIEDYILYLLNDRKLAWNSCNVAVSGIKFLYNVTLKDRVVAFQMPVKKKLKKLPVVYSVKEVEKIIYAHTNVKHRVVLMVAYSGGLRSSEITHLKAEDIDSQRMLIRVREGKGKKDRYTLLSKTCLNELRYYYRNERPVNWLFPSSNPDCHIHQNTLNQIFRSAKKKAGISKGIGIHSLRHTFATHLLENGYDIRTIQKLLGHESIKTTSIYLHVAHKPDEIQSPMDLIRPDTDPISPWE